MGLRSINNKTRSRKFFLDFLSLFLDLLAKIIPIRLLPKYRRFSNKNPKMFDFHFNTPILPHQDQRSVLKVRECAQSIPRINLPLKMILLGLKLITPNFDAFFTIFWPRKIFRGSKNEKNASKLGVVSFNPNKIIFRDNFIREIYCAHSRTLKTLPWPWFREGIGVLKRKSNISAFYEKTVDS